MDRVLVRAALGAVMLAAVTPASALASPGPVADAAAGRGVFASQCSSCHSDARSRPALIGPPLFGVVGRPAGSIAGFAYSTTMKHAGFAWTPDRLRAYLPAPQRYLPGVKMTYPGLKSPQQLDQLIAYLGSLK
ncbi:MAG TPA: c-type cytochrome [Caulobacteraceae bacterium]|nr:c-type cytochrome [Caulobacteraceae bacterium]